MNNRFKKFLEHEAIKAKPNYDFSNSNFTIQSDPITFRCKVHDKEITVDQAARLLSKSRNENKCSDCREDLKQDQQLKDFKIRASNKFNNKYDYNLIEKYGYRLEVTIVCPKHGSFKQTPLNHVQSHTGCLKCGLDAMVISATELGGYSRSDYINKTKSDTSNVYVIKLTGNNESFYKIGITSHSIKQRFKQGALVDNYSIEVKHLFKDLDKGLAYDFEKLLHRKNKQFKYEPLIKFAGYTECFNRVPEDIKEYLSLLETLN